MVSAVDLVVVGMSGGGGGGGVVVVVMVAEGALKAGSEDSVLRGTIANRTKYCE